MLRGKKLKAPVALLWIVLSIFVFSGIPFFYLKFYNVRQNFYKKQSQYQIRSIVQKGPVKEALKTLHLTEILGLSTDEPQNLISYDLKRGEELLLGSSVISGVNLRKILPDTLEIDYETRRPIAYLKDYSNTVIDSKGVIFPLSPYFTPKVLPKIYLGISIEPFMFGRIKNEKMKIALEVLELVSKLNANKNLFVDCVDVSKINAKSLGKQEIVLTFYENLGEESYIRYLRLSKENYEQEFIHFLNLKAMNLPKNLVVDLRLFPNAYLTTLQHQ